MTLNHTQSFFFLRRQPINSLALQPLLFVGTPRAGRAFAPEKAPTARLTLKRRQDLNRKTPPRCATILEFIRVTFRDVFLKLRFIAQIQLLPPSRPLRGTASTLTRKPNEPIQTLLRRLLFLTLFACPRLQGLSKSDANELGAFATGGDP